jgi:guanosine-3',5'-bis(diphosphate) 3'-pyrophosphohydrolase
MEESVSQKEKERAEEAMIEQAFQELLNDYLATKHRKRVEIITKAFNFANQAHKGIKRRSGEPYIMHPIAVAKIVCNEIGLGSTSICAALLHDVVEDTDYTVEDIENIFGPKIAQIVDGLTKISGGILGAGRELQETAAYHVRRHPRYPHKDSRPAAQYAHTRFHAAQQAVQDSR